MRISDWSSDVCSSDYHRAMRDRAARIAQHHHRIVRVAEQAERVHRAIAQDARIAAARGKGRAERRLPEGGGIITRPPRVGKAHIALPVPAVETTELDQTETGQVGKGGGRTGK